MDSSIKKLLDCGLNAQDANGKTPLILAAWTGDLETVRKLLSSGADFSITDELGENVLHYAARQHNPAVLSTILNTGIDINVKSGGGYKQTAIFTPAETGNVPILKLLLESGADPDILDKYKMTALHWAAQQGQPESIKMLLEFKAKVNTKNNKGITPLMSASIKGIMETIVMLADAEAKINAAAKDGFTALMFAAYYGHADAVKYLLAKGADKNMITKKNETALSIAEKKKFTEVVSLLS